MPSLLKKLNPDNKSLTIAAIVIGLINLTNGDPGLFLVLALGTAGAIYHKQITAALNLPAKSRMLLLAGITVPGAYLMHSIDSPAMALFFGGFKDFLNGTLGVLLPGTANLFPIIIAIFQFVFLMYVFIATLRNWNGRDNDEDWGVIFKTPIKAFIILSVLDLILSLVIA